MIMAVKLPIPLGAEQQISTGDLRPIREPEGRLVGSDAGDPLEQAEAEALALLNAFKGLHRTNFSKDVLQRAADRTLVFPCRASSGAIGAGRKESKRRCWISKRPAIPREFLRVANVMGQIRIM
jgi:hypothetical protein